MDDTYISLWSLRNYPVDPKDTYPSYLMNPEALSNYYIEVASKIRVLEERIEYLEDSR